VLALMSAAAPKQQLEFLTFTLADGRRSHDIRGPGIFTRCGPLGTTSLDGLTRARPRHPPVFTAAHGHLTPVTERGGSTTAQTGTTVPQPSLGSRPLEPRQARPRTWRWRAVACCACTASRPRGRSACR
jgi:hypothetical protein